MGRDALLGNAMHLLRSNLHFKWLAGMNHGGMQRLIEIRPRHRDVVFEASRDRPPNLMNHAEGSVAVLHIVGDHADGQQVVNLVERTLLRFDFQMQREEALDAAFNFRRNSAGDHSLPDAFLHIVEKAIVYFLLGGNFLGQLDVSRGLQVAKSEVLQFSTDESHTKSVGNWSVDIDGLAGDALLALGFEKLERAHIVETVGELDHHDPNVVDHREQHLANIFGLARFGREEIETADFRGAFDEARDLWAEHLRNTVERNFRILDDIMKERGGERGCVELHVGENMGHFERMREIGFA
jgi:hypothetical protein